MSSSCTDFGRFCKFEPRYDYVRSEGKWPESVDDTDIASEHITKIIKETQKLEKRYVHDICVQCGEVVHRKAE